MTRQELLALRKALDQMLSWPDPVREAIMQWLTPQASAPGSKSPGANGLGNGAGQERIKTLNQALAIQRPAAPVPYAGKERRGRQNETRVSPSPPKPPPLAKAAERRLLEAMQEHSGASVHALAKACVAGRSATGERLRKLAAQGAIEKDPDGRWRLKSEAASTNAQPGPPASREAPGPQPPSPN